MPLGCRRDPTLVQTVRSRHPHPPRIRPRGSLFGTLPTVVHSYGIDAACAVGLCGGVLGAFDVVDAHVGRNGLQLCAQRLQILVVFRCGQRAALAAP